MTHMLIWGAPKGSLPRMERRLDVSYVHVRSLDALRHEAPADVVVVGPAAAANLEDAVRSAVEARPTERVLVAWGPRHTQTIVRCLQAGADGYEEGDPPRSAGFVPRLASMEKSGVRRRPAPQIAPGGEPRPETPQGQKLEALSLMAGGIAHGFNNLLVGIMGNADLALLELDRESCAHASVRRIADAAQRAAELSHQMLMCAGRGHRELSPIDLSALARGAVYELGLVLGEHTRLELSCDARLPLIEVDPAQVREILRCLLKNAADAIGANDGVIQLNTGLVEGFSARAPRHGEPSPCFDITCSPIKLGTYAFIEVVDTGKGMNQATLERAFEPFFTTKKAGRGLGLSTVMGIVRGHRGAVQVQTEPGHGSRFRVLLPAGSSMHGGRELERASVAPKLGAIASGL